MSGFEDHFAIQGASVLFRKGKLMSALAERVRGLTKDDAYRVGIGPMEYEAILAARVSEIELHRLESLHAKLELT